MKSESFALALVYCLVLAAILITLEIVVRKSRLSPNISRRFAHVGSGLFSLVMWNMFTPMIFLACGGTLLLLISLSYYRRLLTSVHNVPRKTYGEIFLPIGIIATYALAADKPEIFVPSILIMTFADACAGIIGDLRQKQRPSRLGSIVFFAVAVTILIFYVNPGAAITVAFVAMVVEKISPYGSDNATIPVTVALLLSL